MHDVTFDNFREMLRDFSGVWVEIIILVMGLLFILGLIIGIADR